MISLDKCERSFITSKTGFKKVDVSLWQFPRLPKHSSNLHESRTLALLNFLAFYVRAIAKYLQQEALEVDLSNTRRKL